MNPITRRSLLTTTALAGIGLGVAACSGSAAGNAVLNALPQVATQLQTIAKGLIAALPSLSSATGLSGGALKTITTAVNDISTVAGTVAPGLTPTQGQSVVATVEGDLNVVVAAAAGLPLPPPFGPALAAAALLMPVVEGALNMAISYLSPQTQAVAAAAQIPNPAPAAGPGAPPTVHPTPAQAEAYLAALAK